MDMAMEAVKTFFKEERDSLFRRGEAKKSLTVVENLLSANKFSIAEIANFASVTEDFVKKAQKNRNKIPERF